MLKTITIEEVKAGMFVHDLKLSWWKHSFVLPRFLIDSRELLDKVKNSGAKEIIIDEAQSNYRIQITEDKTIESVIIEPEKK